MSEAAFGPCLARFDGGELVIGNGLVTRRWRVDNGLLTATSLKIGDREWVARSGPPAPVPPHALPAERRTVQFFARSGRCGPTEEPSLAVELLADGPSCHITYRFQVFAGSASVTMQLAVRQAGEAAATQSLAQASAAAAAPTGIELAQAVDPKDPIPPGDCMENFAPSGMHLRLTQVTLVDQTDGHNELVFEKEYLLHPSEATLAMSGNLFLLEDPVSGEGLAFVKLAPLPASRAVKSDCDFRAYCGSGFAWGVGSDFGPGHPAWPLAYRISLGGHGMGPLGGEGDRWATIAYHGGRCGAAEALQRYQRQFRTYEPSRDGLFLSNTWGDRSQDKRMAEAFVLGEIEAAARLGVDVVQLDDGWQKGRTSNSATPGGVWLGFHAAEPRFWDTHPERFPRGLAPLVEACARHGLGLGLWFAPDSADDFTHWRRDADVILDYHRRCGINQVKIDGVKAHTRASQDNLRRFFDRVLEESAGRVAFDLDVTAETRPGYFGLMHTGPIFVENRYTDWHRYWPHHTLRNLWKLAQYVDPRRLRMELLNTARNPHLYAGDPLAPARYRADYLFASVMFANPLGWFELTNLPAEYVQEAAPLVRLWKQHRANIFRGTTWPVGAAPDGASWTGFLSMADDRREGYLLAFREQNDRSTAIIELPMLGQNEYRCEVLHGAGTASIAGGRAAVAIPRPLDFIFTQVSAL